ncbi:hypothetical protein [Candidatus Enterococcus leclercqii]|uniref:hypothetical protein n=1 Tax=Candidatus Enterococcus leclercqii TaxID=1857218 RepID=UPI00137A8101|nr:hypothetical protein [Enterococcus sp. CU9D]
MSKTDKELAIDVAIAVINAHPATKVALSSGGSTEVYGLDLKSINNIIQSVHKTLQSLPEEKH